MAEVDKVLSVQATDGRLDRVGEAVNAIEAGMRTIFNLELVGQGAIFAALAYLHQKGMGEAFVNIIPYTPAIGIVAAFAGWYFNEIEREKARKQKQAGAVCERYLESIGAHVPAPEWIDASGEFVERDVPQFTAIGSLYGMLALLWIIPSVYFLYAGK